MNQTNIVRQCILFLILTDAGGEGKTMLALLIRALLELAGEPVGFIDSDAGNLSGAIQINASGAAASLRVMNWQVSTHAASNILAEHVGSHIIVDTGANMTAAGQPIGAMLPLLQAQAQSAGYRTVAILPVSTNKSGAVGALAELAKLYPQWEHVFVQVNRDGSRNFEVGLDPGKTVQLNHLQPGYQELIRTNGGLAEVVRNPQAGYDRAADAIAGWMTEFAQQPLIDSLLGGRTAFASELGRRQPPVTRMTFRRMGDVTDEALAYNEMRTTAMNILDRYRWSAEGHQEVIRQLIASTAAT